jgi:hypothetical protein
MSQYRQTNKVVTIAAGDTARVWDAPISQPFKDLTIYLSSGGLVTAVGNLVWNVYYGGCWTGKPYVSTSVHSGGISQANGVLGAIEYAHFIWEDSSMLPANNLANPNTDYFHSTPVVVELANGKAVPLTVYVTFGIDTVGPNT